ncbi:PREDICTED: D-aspartate oxidase-like [Rhagoletis zephyria]|uniref:D-aspartate oxidase-like n=1 Tax=Rhagoletis zephyria TaxID=28612 RepID=UPI0008112D99|nr:PREDICTED: D-aspartate oxidase-like [Rhagoletis zephyria]
MAPVSYTAAPNLASQQKLKVAVVGGGVIGVCSALALQQEFPTAEVTIFSEKWSPQTTGDVSAGFIYPYAVGEQTPPCLLKRTLADTVQFYERLIRNPESGKFGLSLLTMYDLSKEATMAVPSLPELYDVRPMEGAEVAKMFPGYRSGVVATTYIAEPTLLLPFLMGKFEGAGGRLVTRKITALGQLTGDHDLVVNCSGLGARYLADVQDLSVEAVRGQVVRVRAPWIRHAVMAGPSYILPNRDCVILGGTKELANYNLSPDPATAELILRDCAQVVPSLLAAEKIGDFVGLRPYRPSLRIEADARNRKVIHNYGHGGSGVTLCWGSALEVVKLAKKALGGKGMKSKL